MNRGPSNGGRVGAMKNNALATLAPGKKIPLTNGKAGNVPAIPVKVAAPVAKPEAA